MIMGWQLLLIKEFSKKNLKESSIRDWRDAYLKDFKEKTEEAKPGEKVVVTALSSKKMWKACAFGCEVV